MDKAWRMATQTTFPYPQMTLYKKCISNFNKGIAYLGPNSLLMSDQSIFRMNYVISSLQKIFFGEIGRPENDIDVLLPGEPLRLSTTGKDAQGNHKFYIKTFENKYEDNRGRWSSLVKIPP